MKEVTYSAGTVFRTYVTDGHDALGHAQGMVYSVLAQVDKNKFQLLSLESGNRWLSKKMKGNGEGSVTRKALGEHVKKIQRIDSIEPIGHCADVDYDRLLGVYDTDDAAKDDNARAVRAQAQAETVGDTKEKRSS